ncbi:MAG: tetratricopeptide repeat protein [Hyphomonadaceae bacterium]
MSALCDEESLQALVRDMQTHPETDLERIDALLAQFPDDPRLLFLRGSNLISKGRLIEAHRAMTRAVTLAPDFDIARFQLGFFQLTSGEADNALETWGRLDRLPDTHYLRVFVDGLRRLIRDDFAGAIESLERGILANQENPPLSRDMQLIIDRCQPLLHGQAEDGAESETSLILQHFVSRGPPN